VWGSHVEPQFNNLNLQIGFLEYRAESANLGQPLFEVLGPWRFFFLAAKTSVASKNLRVLRSGFCTLPVVLAITGELVLMTANPLLCDWSI
jgi:hypothetical protein